MRSDIADRLRRALGPVPLDPAEAAGALAADDAARSLAPWVEGARRVLSPWAVWTLMVSLRYLPRQRWVGELVRDGVLRPHGSGNVPGFPGWTYNREGPGCRVSHDETGEEITVELYRGSAEYIHPFAVLGGAQPSEHPEPPEARVRALHPVMERVVVAFDELDAEGAVIRHDCEYVYCLSAPALELDADVRAFVTRWAGAPRGARAWLAATLGDWLLAAELCPGDARIEGAVERCLAERARRLESKLDDARFGMYALEALVEVAPADWLRRYLVAALEGTPDGLTRKAAQMIVEDKAGDSTREMKELFERLSPEQDTDLVTLTAGYLLQRGHPPALVFPTLLRAARVDKAPGVLFGKNPYVLEIALLALEHAPGEALPLVRRALRESPSVRQHMAGVLMTLGGAWAERELLAALRESTDEMATACFRVALRRCGGPEALAEVERWEAAHESPLRGPAWSSFNAGMIDLAIASLAERVERLRRTLPVDFGGELSANHTASAAPVTVAGRG